MNKKLKYSYLLILFLFIGCTLNSFSQLYNFQTYSLDEGLSQSEVNCIFEDSRGYLWIGTSGGGLNCFDGKQFVVYEEKDGLCGQIVNTVCEDKNHDIWVGTRLNSLCNYNGKKITSFTDDVSKSFVGGTIEYLAVDDNNNLMVTRSNAIVLYDGSQFQKLEIKGDTLKNYNINCVKKDSRNIIWIGTNHGLLVLKNKTLLRISDNPDIYDINITSITEDLSGVLWIIQDKKQFHKIKIIGPSHYQVKASRIDSIACPEDAIISGIHFDKQNQLWIATQNKGIYKLRHKELFNFNQSNGLPVDHINCVYEDVSGNVWIGTSGGGLVKFTNQAFAYYDNIEGLNQKDIFAISADKNNNVWVGTSLHGVYKYNGKNAVKQNHPYLTSNEVRCIYTDSKGVVWLGTTNGIIQYASNTYKLYKDQSIKNIRAIFEDAAGNIFIGTRGNFAYLDNGKIVKQLNNNSGIYNENVYSFVQDKENNVWIGTANGVFVFNGEKVIKHLVEGLCNSYVGSMTKDKFENIWVGTDNCVGWYNGKGFTSITQADGLASGTVYLMNTDLYGNIWVGTNKGIDKISLNEKGQISTIRNYGKAEGFKGIECNSRATCIDNDGNLWFGTIKGAIRFSPKEEIFRARETPKVHITGIKLFYEDVDWIDYSDSLMHWFQLPINPVFAYDKNHITFYFAAISKTFPENIRYSFKLDGFDSDWSPFSEINSATYSNLPPGDYHFMLRAENKDGISAEADSVIEFRIKQPYWTTWWFVLFCIAGFVGLIYLYNEYRKRKHIVQKQRLEKIIKERTAEIIKKRDENEILLKEVHHRVKNNLQIINSLINIQSDYINEPKATELFREIRNRIRTISLVHEKLYKSEDYGNINVKEYINMLVENLIDTYSFNKNVELKLNLEVQHFNLNTIIPLGLLLNEIISNSFKYAFNDSSDGVIEIELYKSSASDEYTVIVGDNGKGFDDKLFTNETPTLGLELVKILATQLNGSIEKIQKPGTYYILKFKPLKD
jgi:two-component sensor histidine kinase/ligand-binding sensor domain-containing protein